MEEEKERPITMEDTMLNDAAFRKQFDPKSESYHHGDPTKVPLGGQRIPTSMPTVYDENTSIISEIAQKELENHPTLLQYNAIKHFKNLIAKVGPFVEAQLRHYEIYEKSKTEDAMVKMVKANEAEKIKLEALLKEIESAITQNKSFFDVYDATYKKIVAGSHVEYKTRTSYFDYQTILKQFQVTLNKDMTNKMNEYKKVKKEFIDSKMKMTAETKPENKESQSEKDKFEEFKN